MAFTDFVRSLIEGTRFNLLNLPFTPIKYGAARDKRSCIVVTTVTPESLARIKKGK